MDVHSFPKFGETDLGLNPGAVRSMKAAIFPIHKTIVCLELKKMENYERQGINLFNYNYWYNLRVASEPNLGCTGFGLVMGKYIDQLQDFTPEDWQRDWRWCNVIFLSFYVSFFYLLSFPLSLHFFEPLDPLEFWYN